jgi:hypothetical protein
MEFFERKRPRLGERSQRIVLGDLELLFCGLDAELQERLEQRYAPFRGAQLEPGVTLKIEVFREERGYFIQPSPGPESNPVLLDCEGPRVRYLGYRVAGWFDAGPGRGEMLLAQGSYEPVHRAVENYVRASVAWLAAARGGALVHAASAVLEGHGYLFYGESGAGKSTLAACNRRARVISDDLSLVLPGPGGEPDLVGSPFRGTYEEGEVVTGRFPLVAGFRIVKARRAEVRPVPRLRALSELVGNLPFVAEAFGRRPDLFEKLQAAFGSLPLAHLHFCKDDSYWNAIEEAGLTR